MPDKKFDLGDYVEVKDRIKLFYELYGQGRLVTGEVRLSNEPDGVPRVMVQGLAYRSPEDTLPGVGWSWMVLPGTSNYTRGSELENTETSAWGRAIGALGILIDRSIASAQEVGNKADDQPLPSRSGGIVQTEAHPSPLTDDGGLIGTAITEGNYDFGLRQIAPDPATPDILKWKLGFRIKNGSKSFIVVAEDTLAEIIAPLKAEIIDNRVTVWGSWRDMVTPAKGTRPEVKYRILVLSRIATSEFTLPRIEAPSVGMFDDDFEALDAELDAAS